MDLSNFESPLRPVMANQEQKTLIWYLVLDLFSFTGSNQKA